VTFRQAILGVIDAVMPIAGPNVLDVTAHQLTITVYQWSGGARDKGTRSTVSALSLPQYSGVRQMSLEEIANSGGRYRDGAVLVEDITPSNGVIGFTPSQLRPVIVQGQELVYSLSAGTAAAPAGPLAGEYQIAEGRFDDEFGYALVLNRRLTTP
jgi:hypothetical protein